MIIYIVRKSITWHNTDPVDETFAYDSMKGALTRFVWEKSRIKGFIINKCERTIDWERDGDDNYHAITSADDYVDLWVEKISLNTKK